MKIAILTETFPPEVNGVAMTIERLVMGMEKRGHFVSVFRPSQGNGDQCKSLEGVSQTLMPGGALPRYPGLRFGYPGRRRFIDCWRSNRPDIVHVVTEGPLGWSAVTAARRLRIPVTSSFHTNFHAYSRHYGFPFLRRLGISYLRFFHNRTLATFAPTRQLCGELERKGFRTMRVMGRGIDPARFSPLRRNAVLRANWGGGRGPVFLYVGRLAPEKNISLAVRAFMAFKEGQPEATFVLVGSGPLERELRRSYPDFVFAGVRRGESLAAYYASADLFVFPSLTETYGNVVTEAMASGVPVLAFDYAAVGEHVVSWKNGVAIEMGDEEAYLSAARRLATNPGQLPCMGAVAYETASALTWDSVVEKWESELLTVVKTGYGGRPKRNFAWRTSL